MAVVNDYPSLYEENDLQQQAFFRGERTFRSRLENTNLDEGYDPDYDPDLDLGVDIDDKRNRRIFFKDSFIITRELWREISDFTELYCLLYESLTSEEAEFMHDSLGPKEDDDDEADYVSDKLDTMLSDMLEFLVHDLRAKEDEESFGPYKKEICDLISDDQWEFNWRAHYWRSLPGFPELYCSLYDTMSCDEASNMVSQYISVKLPDKIDPNIYFMLEALDSDLYDKEKKQKRRKKGSKALRDE